MKSQINNIKLAISSMDNQIKSLKNTKDIQLINLDSQSILLQQNYEIANRAVSEETLYAEINGTIKNKLVGK